MDNQLQTVPPSNKLQSIKSLLESKREEFIKALPKHLPVDKLLRVALTAIQRTPKLLDCTPASLYGSIMQAASLGLEPDGLQGQAYLVPYKSTCTLIVGYRGLISLARRSGDVSTVAAHVVHEKDQFTFQQGTEPFLHHVPWLADDPGEVIAAYSVAKMKDGSYQFEVQSLADLEKIRARSKATHDGPWVTDTEEMYRKCPVRKLCKYLPASPELQTAVTLDEAGEEGRPQGLELFADGVIQQPRLRRASEVQEELPAAEAPSFDDEPPAPAAAPAITQTWDDEPPVDEPKGPSTPPPPPPATAPAPKPKAAPKPKPAPPAPAPAPSPAPLPMDSPTAPITKEMFERFLTKCMENGWSDGDIADLLDQHGLARLRMMTQAQFPTLLEIVSHRRE